VFRECGDCTVCCEGWLAATIYSHKMYPGKSCYFLKEGKCTVYSVRPTTCRKYQCGWSQHLLPEQYRPDKCGVVVSVKDAEDGQYLMVYKFRKDADMNILEHVEKFCRDNNTEYRLKEIDASDT